MVSGLQADNFEEVVFIEGCEALPSFMGVYVDSTPESVMMYVQQIERLGLGCGFGGVGGDNNVDDNDNDDNDNDDNSLLSSGVGATMGTILFF